VSPHRHLRRGLWRITAVTLQIPYGLLTFFGLLDDACPIFLLATEFLVTESGVAGTLSALTPQPDQVHALTVCDMVLPGRLGYSPVGGLPSGAVGATGGLVRTDLTVSAGGAASFDSAAICVSLAESSPHQNRAQQRAQPVP
jgi:hypothetical protein